MRHVTLSVLKATEGGPGYGIMKRLADAGIPARRGHTPYIGHVGVEVPAKFERRACRIAFGGWKR